MREQKKKQGPWRKAVTALAIVLLVAGVGVLLYPTIEEWFYQRSVASQKEAFLHQIKPGAEESPDGINHAFDDLYAYLQQENQRLYEEGQADLSDAFSYEQPAVDFSAYGLAENCVGYISLPTIDMELPIYLGASRSNLEKGAVHLTQTSYPIGGVNTNAVIAAHRGGSKLFFRNIHLLQVGDEVSILNVRETLTYRVAEIKIIRPNEIDQILIQEGRDLVTLVSCHPLGNNYLRYVVYCERMEES